MEKIHVREETGEKHSVNIPELNSYTVMHPLPPTFTISVLLFLFVEAEIKGCITSRATFLSLRYKCTHYPVPIHTSLALFSALGSARVDADADEVEATALSSDLALFWAVILLY